ncbi:MAG TPA: FtsX-like permease family protein [Chitinivibrionales bacterium]|nr:FtsX-like permease family protein [Chitinivibrionales bacterium]
MGMILKIALRNIGRHKRRTILSAITIAAGLLVFIYMDSALTGVDRMSIDNLITLSAGALKIDTRRYDEEKESFPLTYTLDSTLARLTFALSKDKRVSHVTRRTLFLGQLSNYEETIPVVGTVIDPATDTLVFGLRRYLAGSFLDTGSTRSIIMGKQLAQDLGVGAGDNITLYALTKYDSRNADVFRIAGLLSTADPVINHSGVFMTYAAANDFLDLENSTTELDVAVPRNENLARFSNTVKGIQRDLQADFPSLRINSFLDLGAGVMEITRAKRISMFVVMGIILIIAVVGIFNTVFMSVYERIREIGVLRAHGMKPSDISAMFLVEGAVTGLLGGVLGVSLGALVNLQLVTQGIPMEKIAGSLATASYGIAGNIYGEWNAPAMAVVFVLGVAVATIAGIIPARRASKIQVTEALRFN